MCDRFHVIMNNGNMRDFCYACDNKSEAITECQHLALSFPYVLFIVIDTEPEDYKYEIYYAEYAYNLYLSEDGKSWNRIQHKDCGEVYTYNRYDDNFNNKVFEF